MCRPMGATIVLNTTDPLEEEYLHYLQNTHIYNIYKSDKFT